MFKPYPLKFEETNRQKLSAAYKIDHIGGEDQKMWIAELIIKKVYFFTDTLAFIIVNTPEDYFDVYFIPEPDLLQRLGKDILTFSLASSLAELHNKNHWQFLLSQIGTYEKK